MSQMQRSSTLPAHNLHQLSMEHAKQQLSLNGTQATIKVAVRIRPLLPDEVYKDHKCEKLSIQNNKSVKYVWFVFPLLTSNNFTTIHH